jgi:hypothetical protein
MKSAQVINETTGQVVKSDLNWNEAYRLSLAYTKNSKRGHRYIANDPHPAGRAPYNKIDGWQ